jgi:hypothetical protein
MSKNEKNVPTTDTDFNDVQAVIAEKVAANIINWGIDPNWFNNTFLPARQKWERAWIPYKDKSQRTPLITFEKNQARKEYEPHLRLLVKNLEINTLVTNEERASMGILPPKPRTPVSVPTSRPSLYIKTDMPTEITIDFRDYESTSRAKPAGVHGIEIKYAMLDFQPKDPEELIHSVFDTRSPYTLKFNGHDRGKTVYIAGRWENTKGEKGPWCDIITVIIP